MIKVSVQGRNAIVNAMQARMDRYRQEIGDAIQGAGINTQAYAKQNCPVDTGRLRASIAYNPTGQYSCTVGTNVNYAAFVELGTRKMRGRAYLYPGFLQAVVELKDELRSL